MSGVKRREEDGRSDEEEEWCQQWQGREEDINGDSSEDIRGEVEVDVIGGDEGGECHGWIGGRRMPMVNGREEDANGEGGGWL